MTLQWRHNERDGVSKHRRLHCLLNCWFRHRSKKTTKLRITGLCAGNSPVTGKFTAQKASDAENVSIWWRHHDDTTLPCDPSFAMCIIDVCHCLLIRVSNGIAYWATISVAKYWSLYTMTLFHAIYVIVNPEKFIHSFVTKISLNI